MRRFPKMNIRVFHCCAEQMSFVRRVRVVDPSLWSVRILSFATVLFYIVATIFHMDTQQMVLIVSIASSWNVLGLTMSFLIVQSDPMERRGDGMNDLPPV